MITGIKNRKRVPLLDKEGWGTIPWEVHAKSPKDRLIDIWGEVGGVLEDVDSARATADANKKRTLKKRITLAASVLLARLRDWHGEMGPLMEFRDTNGDVIAIVGREDLIQADIALMYWTTCLLVSFTTHLVADGSDTPLPCTDPIIYIRFITAAMPYFWQPAAGLLGVQVTSFPLALCLHVLCVLRDTRTTELTGSVMELFRQQEGKANIAGFLSSIQMDIGDLHWQDKLDLLGLRHEPRAEQQDLACHMDFVEAPFPS